MIRLTLPWPPSANRYWRHPSSGPLAGRHLISAEGRTYRSAVHVALVEQLQRHPRLRQRLAVRVEAAPPDNRVRDLDNLSKGLLDALTHAGLWVDDSQIDDTHTIRRLPVPGGRIVLTVRDADPLQALQPLQEAA